MNARRVLRHGRPRGLFGSAARRIGSQSSGVTERRLADRVASTAGWPTGDPAPPELAGRWYQASGAIIVFSGHDYTFPGAGGGNLVVNGNEITFFNGFNCGEHLPGGIGRYSWTVTGTTLNFTQLVDPCSRIDGTWTRTKS